MYKGQKLARVSEDAGSCAFSEMFLELGDDLKFMKNSESPEMHEGQPR